MSDTKDTWIHRLLMDYPEITDEAIQELMKKRDFITGEPLPARSTAPEPITAPDRLQSQAPYGGG